MKTTRMGPSTAGRPRQHPPLKKLAAAAGASIGVAKPEALPDVAHVIAQVQLIDGKTAADVGGMSLSWWHEKVAEGIAPQPVFRAPRCTRWRAVDVAAFWRDWRPGEAAEAACVDLAAKASAKATEARRVAAEKASAQTMLMHQHDGDAPLGPVTHTSDNAPRQSRVEGEA